MRPTPRKSQISLALAITGASLTVNSARAEGPFLITDRVSATPQLAALFDGLADTLVTTVNDSIFSTDNQALFADGMAGANSSGNSGLIADRATDPTLVSLSAGIQANIFGVSSLTNLDFTTSNSLPSVGVGLHSALTVGLNMGKLGVGKIGPIDGSRLKLYLSYLSYDLDFSSASANLTNLGMNLQYKVVPPIGLSFLAKWGGVDLLTGVNYVTNRATYSGSLSQTSQDGAGSQLTATFDYDLGVESKVFYIPIEVSTSLQVLYIVTAYGGAGVDLNFGSAGLVGGGSGDISAVNNNLPESGYSAKAVLDFDTYGYKASPSLINTRGFLGAQFNLSILKVGGEMTFSTQGNTSFGLYGRVVF
jgi:hypothetical protein